MKIKKTNRKTRLIQTEPRLQRHMVITMNTRVERIRKEHLGQVKHSASMERVKSSLAPLSIPVE